MADRGEQQLLAAFRALAGEDRQALLAFAGFLVSRSSGSDSGATVAVPQPEFRPQDESVVMAIKRLTRTYPMLDRRKLMGPISLLVSQHALQGRPAAQVIDDLEAMFELNYREHMQPQSPDD